MSSSKRSVIAVVPDLYFATRIAATAQAAGVALELVPPAGVEARLAASGAGGAPSLVILDLHAPQALAIIRTLKRLVSATPVVGFYSHVETALAENALAAGADAALPRSRFVTKLAALLAEGVSALARGGPAAAPGGGGTTAGAESG